MGTLQSRSGNRPTGKNRRGAANVETARSCCERPKAPNAQVLASRTSRSNSGRVALWGTEGTSIRRLIDLLGNPHRPLTGRVSPEWNPVPRIGPELAPLPMDLVVAIRLGVLVYTVLWHLYHLLSFSTVAPRHVEAHWYILLQA